MGYFSWLTSDTKVSISAVDVGQPPVYLLQPGGQPPIEEPAYGGYGIFGGINAYVWLARANLAPEKVATLSEDDLCDVGIMMAHSNYFEDTVTGKKISVFHNGADLIDPEITVFKGVTYAAPLPGFDGKSANELAAAGRLKPRAFDVRFPLKFSFDAKAIYENLPAAEICPDQGRAQG